MRRIVLILICFAVSNALLGQDELHKPFKKADKLLSQHARHHPGDPELWYLLAEAQGKSGNILGLHQSRAEYFALNGAMKQAIEQLNYALPLATNTVIAERIHTRIEYFRNIEKALKHLS